MRRVSSPTLLLLTVVVTLGCRTTPDDAGSPPPGGTEGPVVAAWRGGRLSQADVELEMQRLSPTARAKLSDLEQKRELVDRIVTNRLLVEEGTRRGYAEDPEITRQLNALRDRLVVQRVMRDLRARPTVSDEEARRHYEDNLPLYATTRVRASHILVADEKTARVIYDEVTADPDRYAALAREKSTDQMSAKRGGDLGVFGAGRMVEEFERVAFALQPGEIGQPIQTRYGWHVIRVVERYDGDTRPFDDVKTQITSLLANRKIEAQVTQAIAGLRAAAHVRIDDASLAAIDPPTNGPPPPHARMGGH